MSRLHEQVVDASLVIKWLVAGERFTKKARKLHDDAILRGITLIGPSMLVYEVESNLQYRLTQGSMTRFAANEALGAFYKVDVKIRNHSELVVRAREIARRYHQERIYDSLYAALAQLRGCEFWTADRAFCEAVKKGLPFYEI